MGLIGLVGAYIGQSGRIWPDIAPTASGQKKSRLISGGFFLLRFKGRRRGGPEFIKGGGGVSQCSGITEGEAA